jgi:hypothetical protein
MVNRITSTLWECLKFLKGHWIHGLVLIPAALAYTYVHESLHAFAVVIQGGKVLEFVWVPSENEWGHIRYEFAQNQAYSEFAILAAPYLLVAIILGSGIILIWRIAASSDVRPCIKRAIYVWLFLVPVFDLAYAGISYQLGARNDFYYLFGRPSLMSSYVIGFLAALLACTGYVLQVRVYQSQKLSVPAYAVLAALVVFVVFLLKL